MVDNPWGRESVGPNGLLVKEYPYDILERQELYID